MSHDRGEQPLGPGSSILNFMKKVDKDDPRAAHVAEIRVSPEVIASRQARIAAAERSRADIQSRLSGGLIF